MNDQTLQEFDITQLFTDPTPQLTLAQIMAGGVYTDPTTGEPALPPNSNVQVNQRLVGGTIERASFKSAYNGARVEIFPNSDNTIGFVSYADNGNVVFETIISGANVGDVVMGNYDGGQGAKWDQSAGTFLIRGALSAGSLDIPDTTTANSAHIDSSGNTWWGCTNANFISNNNNAVAYILKTGVAKFFSVTLTQSVSISGLIAGTELAIQGWQFNSVFSSTDYRIVAWTSGTLRFLDGSSFSISSGNTGNMAAITYIYFDKATSQTVLQVTTTAANAVGVNKVLIAVAQNNADTTKKATFQVFGGTGGVNPTINADNIVAGAITANEIAANTITANKMNVSSLDAISANIGAITAGTITLDTAGYIRGGQTDYATGTGFFLGYSGGAYKFSMGNTSQYLTWDGSVLTFTGAINHLVGDILYQSADTERNNTGGPAMRKEFLINQPGAYRIKFDLKSDGGPSAGTAQIYKNGVAVGTLRSSSSAVYTNYSEDISGFVSGDLLQLYTSGAGPAIVRNFRLYVSQYDAAVVNTN